MIRFSQSYFQPVIHTLFLSRYVGNVFALRCVKVKGQISATADCRKAKISMFAAVTYRECLGLWRSESELPFSVWYANKMWQPLWKVKVKVVWSNVKFKNVKIMPINPKIGSNIKLRSCMEMAYEDHIRSLCRCVSLGGKKATMRYF